MADSDGSFKVWGFFVPLPWDVLMGGISIGKTVICGSFYQLILLSIIVWEN